MTKQSFWMEKESRPSLRDGAKWLKLGPGGQGLWDTCHSRYFRFRSESGESGHQELSNTARTPRHFPVLTRTGPCRYMHQGAREAVELQTVSGSGSKPRLPL